MYKYDYETVSCGIGGRGFASDNIIALKIIVL
jgi:hypothetical protein